MKYTCKLVHVLSARWILTRCGNIRTRSTVVDSVKILTDTRTEKDDIKNMPGVTKTRDPFIKNVNEVIDVRSPMEYLEDHIPGAINLPVLDNQQRVQVGTLYQDSPFEARKIGASLVMQNVAKQFQTYFETKDRSYCPLVYCKKGGQRSWALAYLLNQVGFHVFQLNGGYKHYRSIVRDQLTHLPERFKLLMISGKTGTGKTALLHRLNENGYQVLDLEGIAKHKGSLLGLWHGEKQPSQRYWESSLLERLSSFDPSRPIWIESESRNIGKLEIPTQLFSAMRDAKRFEICLPLEDRVDRTVTEYAHWPETQMDELKKIFTLLEKYRGKKKSEYWIKLLEAGHIGQCVESLMVDHYDSAYAISQKKNANITDNNVIIEGRTLDEVWHKLETFAKSYK